MARIIGRSTTVLQDIASYLKLLPPPGENDEKDEEFLMELLVSEFFFLSSKIIFCIMSLQ